MTNIKFYLYSKYLLELNIYYILINIFLCLIILYFMNFKNNLVLYKNSIFIKILKYLLLACLLVSFFFFLLSFFFYIIYIYNDVISIYLNKNYNLIPNLILFENFYIINIFSLNWFKLDINIDFFGMILLLLAYTIGFLSLMALDNRIYWKNFKYYCSFNIFILIVFLYVSTNNIIFFFLMYESLLLPSFLFVYFISPSRRSIQASIYFVIWTQIGSFLILCVISYLISYYSIYNFYDIKFLKMNSLELNFLYFFIFLGFGLKVPIWPFHYWLTKTHVEAPSGFSMYLSGFLVKSALFGFYKITNTICFDINTSFYITICLMGVLDSSLKMWGQTDIKKLVAYGTIQEMNLIFFLFCLGDIMAINIGILFSATHAFLSALMFYIVDCIYRRYHTRSLVSINGLLHVNPNLSIFIFLMTIFFAGLPGTLKYIVEFFLFIGFLEISPSLTFMFMLIANVLGLIGFSKCWYNLIFGLNKTVFNKPAIDLTFKEFYILLYNFIFLIFFCFSPFFFF